MIYVLQVVTVMNRAGLENRLMDIYRQIDKTKVQFGFYTNRLESGEYDNEIISLGGMVFYSNPISVGHERRKESEFRDFLETHCEYKIIHSHVNEWSTLFCKAAKQANVPIRIAHSRGANVSHNLKSLYKDIIKLPLKLYANRYFAVSREAGMHLFGKKAILSGQVKILPNAIEAEKYHYFPQVREEMRKELGCLNSFVIIHVGNLTEAKNHIMLLEIFKSIHSEDNGSKLFLVGEGNQRSNIEKWIKFNGMDGSITLLGKRSDVSRLLQAADAFVFPSLHEGFPGAVLEAETTGLPCFISDRITSEVVLTNHVVQISIRDTPAAWAEQILGCRGFSRMDQVETIKKAGYDIEQSVLTLEKIYEDCIKEVNSYAESQS